MFELILIVIIVGAVYLYRKSKKEKQEAITNNISTMTLNGETFKLHHHPIYETTIEGLFRVIDESIEIIVKSKNMDTIASRFSVIKNDLDKLKDYSSSTDVNSFTSRLYPYLFNLINQKYFNYIKESSIKSDNAKTKRGKISPLEKVMTSVILHRELFDDKVFTKIIDKLNYKIDFIEAKDLYDKWKKYQFKGNVKKAEESKKNLEYFLIEAHSNLQSIDLSSLNSFDEIKLIEE